MIKNIKKISLSLTVSIFSLQALSGVEPDELNQITIDAPVVEKQALDTQVANKKTELPNQEKDAQLFLEIISSMKTLQANFEQISVNRSSSGVFKVKKPGKFAWVIERPYEKYTLSNGEKVWDYDVDLEEVEISKVNEQNSQMMQLLQSEQTQTLLNSYQIYAERYASETVFTFTPIAGNHEISQIFISFIENKLNSIRIQTDLEQATLIDFSDVIINQTIKDSEFELLIPEGVDVYDATLF